MGELQYDWSGVDLSRFKIQPSGEVARERQRMEDERKRAELAQKPLGSGEASKLQPGMRFAGGLSPYGAPGTSLDAIPSPPAPTLGEAASNVGQVAAGTAADFAGSVPTGAARLLEGAQAIGTALTPPPAEAPQVPYEAMPQGGQAPGLYGLQKRQNQPVAMGAQVQPQRWAQGAIDVLDELGQGVNRDKPQADPRLQDSFLWTTIPQAAASSALFAATGVASGALGASEGLAAGAAGALQESAGDYLETQARLAGKVARGELSPEEAKDKAYLSWLGGLGIGSTEALPMLGMFKRLEHGLNLSIGETLGRMVFEGSEEATQEAVQQLAGNAMQRHLTGDEINLLDGVGGGAGAGAIVGAVMSLAFSHAARMGAPIEGAQAEGAQAPNTPPVSTFGGQGQEATLAPEGAQPTTEPALALQAPTEQAQAATSPAPVGVPEPGGGTPGPAPSPTVEVDRGSVETLSTEKGATEPAVRRFAQHVQNALEAQGEAISPQDVEAIVQSARPAEGLAGRLAQAFGAQAVTVERAGKPLPIEGYLQDRTVVLDRSADEPTRLRQVLAHELWGHHGRKIAEESWTSIRDDLEASFPKLMAEWRNSAEHAYHNIGHGLTEDEAREESVAFAAEEAAGFTTWALSNRNRLETLLTQARKEGRPTFMQHVLELLKRALGFVPNANNQLKLLAREIGTGAWERKNPRDAAEIASRFVKLADEMMRAAAAQSAQPSQSQASQTSPVGQVGQPEARTEVRTPTEVRTQGTERRVAAQPVEAERRARPHNYAEALSQDIAAGRAEDEAQIARMEAEADELPEPEAGGEPRPGNPFRDKANRARALADRLNKPTAHEKGMAESFPLGAGFGRGSQRSRDKATDASIARAGRAVEAENRARYLEAQADAFDRGEINAQGRAWNADKQARSEKRESDRQSREQRIADAKARTEDKERWEISPEDWATRNGQLGGGGRRLLMSEQADFIEQNRPAQAEQPQATAAQGTELVEQLKADRKSIDPATSLLLASEDPLRNLKGAERSAHLERVFVPLLKLAPEEFQYKGRTDPTTGMDPEGPLAKLKTREEFSDVSAGAVLVYRRSNGQLAVVDGHQRVNAAKRLGVPEINAFVINEADGVTPLMARNVGALINMRAERGRAVDAAQVLRDLGIGRKELRSLGLNPGNRFFSSAEALSELADPVFSQVLNEALPEGYGAAIGRAIPKGEEQRQLKAAEMIRRTAQSEEQADSIARQVAQSPTFEIGQESMFGGPGDVKTLIELRSELEKPLLAELKRNRGFFARLARLSGLAETAGATQVDVEAATGRSQAAESILELVQRFADRRGTVVNRILNDAAARIGPPHYGKPAELAREVAGQLAALDWEHPETLEDVGAGTAPPAREQPGQRPLFRPASSENERLAQGLRTRRTARGIRFLAALRSELGGAPDSDVHLEGAPIKALRRALRAAGMPQSRIRTGQDIRTAAGELLQATYKDAGAIVRPEPAGTGMAPSEGVAENRGRDEALRALEQLAFSFDQAVPAARRGVEPRREQPGRAAGSGARTLFDGIRRDLLTEGRTDLRGQVVRSAQDLAVLGQVFTDPRFETFRTFYVDADGKILAHEGLTSRLSGTALIKRADWPIERHVATVRSRMKRLGAAGYYLLHNHPSGNPAPSREDVAVTHKLEALIPGFLGHVVIDHTQFGLIEPGATYPAMLDLPKRRAPRHETDMPSIYSPQSLAGVARDLSVPEDNVAVIYTSTTGTVRAIQSVPDGLVANLQEFANYIRGQNRTFGAAQVFAVSGREDGEAAGGIRAAVRFGVLIDGLLGKKSVRDLMGAESPFLYGGGAQPVLNPPLRAYSVAEPADAFHGSPHEFDRFDTSKIGTGEGAQAYGWGLYFASKKEVADYYKEKLGRLTDVSGAARIKFGPDDQVREVISREIAKEFGDVGNDPQTVDRYWSALWGLLPGITKRSGVEALLREAESSQGRGEVDQVWRVEVRSALALIDAGLLTLPKGGATYKVRLAPNDDEWLLWDEPLSKQSEKVKAALRQLQDSLPGGEKSGLLRANILENRAPTGQDINNRLWAEFDAPVNRGRQAKMAAEALRSVGIRGIKYLDGSSRGRGEGAYNYVVFDAQDVEIRERFRPRTVSEDQEGRASSTGRDESFWGLLNRRILNEFAPVERAQTELEKGGAEVSEASDVTRAHTLFPGLKAEDVRAIRQQGRILRNLLRRSKVGLEEFDDYLRALHAPQRNELMARRHPGSFDPLFNPGAGATSSGERLTPWVIGDILDKVGKDPRAGAFRQGAELIHRLHDAALQQRVDKGILSREGADEWRRLFGPEYVPLRSAEEEGEIQSTFARGSGFQIPRVLSKRAEGRVTASGSPTIWSLAQAEEVATWVRRNEVAQSMASMIREHPVEGLWRVSDEPELDTLVPGVGSDAKQEAVAFWEHGQRRYMVFQGEQGLQIARTLKQLDLERAGLLTKFLGPPGRLFTRLFTQWNPEFLARNVVKDIPTAAIRVAATQSLASGARTAIHVPMSVRGIKRVLFAESAGKTPPSGYWEDLFQEFRRAGGQVGYTTMLDYERGAEKFLSALQRGNGAELVDRMAEAFQDLQKAVELGTRLSVYKVSRDNGMSEADAAVESRQATVDFNRRGELTPALNALYWFFNANVQGARMTAKTLGTPRGAAIGGAIIALGFALDWLNRAMGQDDEDRNRWDETSDWLKDGYMQVLLPSQVSVKVPGSERVIVLDRLMVPLPWGYSMLFTAGTQAGEVAQKASTPTEALPHVLGAAAESFNPIGASPSLTQALSPSITDPFVQVGENLSWSGAAIRPDNPFGQKSPSAVYWPDVSDWARWVADKMNRLGGGNKREPGQIGGLSTSFSPEDLEHLVESYTGGAGQFLKRSIELADETIRGEHTPTRDIPFVRSFAAEPDMRALDKQYRRALRRVRVTDQVARLDNETPQRPELLGLVDQAKAVEKAVEEADDAGQTEVANDLRRQFLALFRRTLAQEPAKQ